MWRVPEEQGEEKEQEMGSEGPFLSKDFYPDGESERGASSDLSLNRATPG